MFCRPPRVELLPYVDLVWSTDAKAAPAPGAYELSLPGSSHHMVIRTGAPLRLFHSAQDRVGEEIGAAVLSGIRLHPVRKAADRPAAVGALLRPDALSLLRAPGSTDLISRHTSLTDIWRTTAFGDHVAHVQTGASCETRLLRFEAMLMRMFRGASAPDPVLRRALKRLDRGARIDAVAAESGFSHRHFCTRFRQAVGLLPVEYRQVRRFDRLIQSFSAPDPSGLAEAAIRAGYADQSHMTREFRAFAGLSVRQYRQLAPVQPRHVLAAA